MIGRTISHYRIIAKLGEGGMGVVYRAEDTTLKRDVALKFLHPEMTRDPEAKARFLQEARAAAALNHPNICTVHEIGDAEGQTFIAMALIEGESLKDRIERGPLRLSDAVDLALQVSEGLAAAHKKGIVHRDMKPANVMVTAEGRARIMDFGLAKSRGQARLTRTGTTTGTIAYMSPEQSRGEDVDHRTDIWSFGVMLYEMVTGRRPFAGDYEQAVIYAIANAEPEPVTGLRTGVPMELERIVRKAMAKRAEERYQHADDVIADLKSLKRELDSGTATVSAIAAAPSKRRAGAAAAWRWAAVAAFAVVALAMVWMATRRGAPTPDLDPNKVVVAVFENRTGDPSLDPIGRMAAGSINEGLAKMGLVEVVPVPIGGEPRSEDAGDPASLAVATGAGLVISGAYYLSGDSLRFQAELTDAREHKVVVTIPDIGGRRVSPTAAIEQLRQRAMGAVAVHMEPYSRWVKPVFPPTYDAYREYSVGMRLFGTDYPAAIQQFERAAALDTTFMMPRLYIATCYYNREEYARADSLLLSLNRRRERLSPHEGMFIDFLRASIRGNRGEEMRILRLMKESTPDDYVPNYLIGITALSLNRPREAVAALSAPVHELKDSAFYDKSWRFGYWADALHVLGEYQ
jgi:tRNA A-37 threonylcarbamoyl transferase component Bud32/tetratricopeptide (TPR) repeat protein